MKDEYWLHWSGVNVSERGVRLLVKPEYKKIISERYVMKCVFFCYLMSTTA